MKVRLKTRYCDEECNIIVGRYAHNSSYSVDFIADDGPMARATVCADAELAHDEILVKTWSENEGMLEALVGLGLVKDTGRRVVCGYAEAAVCQMTKLLLECVPR